jgi:Fe2+ or Zn2+ uptake regulation protein
LQLSCILCTVLFEKMRNTPLQESVLSILKQQGNPISVPELQVLLEDKNLSPNKTSIYRLLEKLKKEEAIEEILLDSRVAFYEWKADHHHHHFVCEKCKTIHCVEDSKLEQAVHQLEHKLEKQGLRVQSHQFSVSGVCPRCIS